jgi:hypothetical protein
LATIHSTLWGSNCLANTSQFSRTKFSGPLKKTLVAANGRLWT